MGKKSKKSDFQKVKLKVGRHLRKGRNVTDIRFKAKKIIVPGQMKEYQGSSANKVNQQLLDLAQALSNVRSSQQVSRLKKITEIISGNECGISSVKIREVMEKVCALLSSRDIAIRKLSLDAIKTIFECFPKQYFHPSYPLMRSLLITLTTNIDSGVRDSALAFLKLVLEYHPLAMHDSIKVLQMFSDLMSRKSSGCGALFTRTLLANPDERFTAQEWRIKVLTSFAKFLNTGIVIMTKDSDVPVDNHVILDSQQHHMVIQCYFSLEKLTANSFKSCFSRMENRNDRLCANVADVETFLCDLLYILFDIWTEAVPNAKNAGWMHDMYDDETPKVALVVLQTLGKLAEWLNLLVDTSFLPDSDFLEEFKLHYTKIIQENVFPHFPIENSPYLGHYSDSLGFPLNIAFCKVFGLIMLGTRSCDASCKNAVINYICHSVCSINIDKKHFSSLFKVLRVLALSRELWDEEDSQLEPIFAVLLHYEHEGHDEAEMIFMDVVLDVRNFNFLNKIEAVQQWLAFLPKKFAELSANGNIQDRHMSSLPKIASLGYPAFMKSLEANFPCLLSVLIGPDERAQKLAADLISKVGNFKEEYFQQLGVAFHNPAVSVDNICTILYMLSHRAKDNANARVWRRKYYSFLFSVAFGFCENEVENDKVIQDISSKWEHNSVVQLHLISPAEGPRHREIVDAVIIAFKLLSDREKLVICMEFYIKVYLQEFSCMPLNAAVAVVKLFNFFSPEIIEGNYLDIYSHVIISLYAYEMELDSMSLPSSEQARYSVYKVLSELDINYIFNIMKLHAFSQRNVETVEYFCHLLVYATEIFSSKGLDISEFSTIMGILIERCNENVQAGQWFNVAVGKLHLA